MELRRRRRWTTGTALAVLACGTVAATPSHAEPGDIVVTTLAPDEVGGLRAALAQAAATADADRIVFDPSLTGTIGLNSDTLLARAGGQAGDLSIVGPGADALAIDAFGGRRILDITGPEGDVRPSVTISGLTLRGGQAHDAGPASDGNGGAVRANGVDLRLERVVLSDNVAWGLGGGVHVGGGSLDVVESSVVRNSAQSGGGISVDGAGAASSALRVAGSVVADNTARPGGTVFSASGGGIHATPGTSTPVTSSIVRDNVAPDR